MTNELNNKKIICDILPFAGIIFISGIILLFSFMQNNNILGYLYSGLVVILLSFFIVLIYFLYQKRKINLLNKNNNSVIESNENKTEIIKQTIV